MEAATDERRDYLQSLVDQHGSIDRAAWEAGVPRDQFRADCHALGVRAHRRPLLPEVRFRSWEEHRAFDELSRETLDQIDEDIEEMFAPIQKAFDDAFLRILRFDKQDPEAAARFVPAYDRMTWQQKELLVLTAAMFFDDADCTRKVAEAFLENSVNRLRDAALLSVAGKTQEGKAG